MPRSTGLLTCIVHEDVGAMAEKPAVGARVGLEENDVYISVLLGLPHATAAFISWKIRRTCMVANCDGDQQQ